jgi:hypothetical protein
MSDSKSYKLTKADLFVSDGNGGETKQNIVDLIGEFTWYESIDCPFARLDIAILDSIGLDSQLYGSEKFEIEFESFAAKSEGKKKATIKAKMKLYKIGSVVKRERSKMYLLHFADEAMYFNETNRAFGMYGPQNGKDNVVQRMLKEQLKIANNRVNVEDYSKINVVSPNWRPVDVISYLTDKVTRTSGSTGKKKTTTNSKNAGRKQSGFLFYQNRDGFHFTSIDKLCEGEKLAIYTYAQKNVEDNDSEANAFKIETVAYPDRSNQLEKMRMGVYQTATIGINLAQPTDSYITQPGASTSSSKPSGTISGPIITKLRGIFTKASTLNKGFPYDKNFIEEFDSNHPTRQKFVILPQFTHMEDNSPNGGADEQSSSLLSAQSYATQRWNLLNTQTLTVSISGNTALYCGGVIEIRMPKTKQENARRVQKDKIFSGKYLIKGLKHTYRKDGITSELYLCRDSVPTGK